uniref:Large ribosomal subunit protein bL25 n=1 Tax=Schlesneria paludicola TaxID=360056 RepID=A0A7C4QLE3_9PLAN
MSTKEAKLVAELRSVRGTRACRRLRSAGLVPGNVYGHREDTQPIVVKSEVLLPLVKSGVRVVDLEVNGQHDKALVREVQWDPFGLRIEHFDLMRVDATERVTLHVPIVLKGTAPGALGGGILEQPLHSLTIDCLAYEIPDAIVAKVGTLEVGQAIHVRDLELPPNVHCHNPPDAIVVHIVEVKVKETLPGEAAAAGAAEPEVIGKKPAEAAAEKEPAKKK